MRATAEGHPGRVHRTAPRIIREIRVDDGGAQSVQVKETDGAIIGTNGPLFRATEIQSTSELAPQRRESTVENHGNQPISRFGSDGVDMNSPNDHIGF